MHDLGRNEDRLRGTYEFPFEFHHIDSSHPRYVMSYHWHVECEIMRVLQGTLTVTLDEKSFTAKAGDVIFVNSGVLQKSIPEEIQIRILHLWSFPEKNISGTVRQALLPFRFLPLQWDFFQNFRKWGFPVQMQRWMHPGCGRRKHRSQVFQKV